MTIGFLIIILGYVSLAVELAFFHVPSVASGVNILRRDGSVVQVYSSRFQWVFNRTLPERLVLTLVPLCFVYLVFAYPLLVVFGVFAVPELLFNGSELFGCGLLIFGRLVTFGSVLTIRRQNRQVSDSFKLHTGSLFARSRNPGLLGMYLFMLGIWLLMPSVLLLLGILFYMGYMHVKVLMEEDFLAQKFGVSYLQYKTATGRYWS